MKVSTIEAALVWGIPFSTFRVGLHRPSSNKLVCKWVIQFVERSTRPWIIESNALMCECEQHRRFCKLVLIQFQYSCIFRRPNARVVFEDTLKEVLKAGMRVVDTFIDTEHCFVSNTLTRCLWQVVLSVMKNASVLLKQVLSRWTFHQLKFTGHNNITRTKWTAWST
jgi:hypothetical protein